jgi:hypothetical protein
MGRDKRELENNTFKKPRKDNTIGESADWGGVDAKILQDCIQTASQKGGALRLGYTRDGGAYAIGVYAGSTYFTDYIRPTENIDQYLTDLTESFRLYDGSAEKAPEASGSKRR